MPTTFDEHGSLDGGSQSELTEAVIEWGSDGITVLGVMGEASALGTDERARVVRSVIDSTSGAVPVAVGCSGAATRTVLDLVDQAAACGAAVAMVSAPPLLRNVDALPGFFADIASRGSLPIIIQDEPMATGVLIPPSILVASANAANAAAVKLEDPPTPGKISAVLRAAPGTCIFGGLGGLMAFHELSRGASGTLTGFSFPEILRSLRIALENGDRDGGFATYARYLPLIAFEAQPGVGLGIRKELLRLRKVIKSAATRVGAPLDGRHKDELLEVLRALAIVPDRAPLQW
jgi:4-hydroxy-tetrahydrodipicolinate synthase